MEEPTKSRGRQPYQRVIGGNMSVLVSSVLLVLSLVATFAMLGYMAHKYG